MRLNKIQKGKTKQNTLRNIIKLLKTSDQGKMEKGARLCTEKQTLLIRTYANEKSMV